jgi:hypothetical protein
MQKGNPIPSHGISKLEKDDKIGFECILESWKYEADLVKSLLEKVSDLVKGLWDSCSDILKEWGIGEIEESLDAIESVAPNIEAVNHVRVSLVIDIEDLTIFDSEAIHFSLLYPMQLATWIDEYNIIVRKGIKKIVTLVIQISLHSCMTKGTEVEEIININNKWTEIVIDNLREKQFLLSSWVSI